ncbi:uncharacterized protein UV8b_06945 [Ustilaginoidea virens]|uniref:Uncharacterized protein n=1 Tax=Ustilaginoidea virens TaxID=1159556 RepID=A0A8E5HW62_USTVR|nr:uncharacterized protein UV8b_06945 [Ustilaginoidea virens]QUC22704.1 hypothetical protein UV8b_06945 [Ustilaginoidea virens]
MGMGMGMGMGMNGNGWEWMGKDGRWAWAGCILSLPPAAPERVGPFALCTCTSGQLDCQTLDLLCSEAHEAGKRRGIGK